MATLTDIWPSRTTPEAIQKSAKVVGVSINGLNVNWMNQETMEHHHSNTATPSKGATSNIVDSRTPEGMRRNPNKYLKFKLQQAEDRNKLSKTQFATKNEVNLIEIPGFLEPKKVRPKKKKPVKFTQVHDLMSVCDILKKIEEHKKAKDDPAKLKQVKAQSQLDLRQKFEVYKVASNVMEKNAP